MTEQVDWLEYAARTWWYAENREGSLDNLDEKARLRVYKHVEDLMGGEVPRSKWTAADKVVAEGRFRVTPEERPPAAFARWVNGYDCIDPGDGHRVESNTRLFGNTHVGQYHLTNLQVAGCVSQGRTFVAKFWYVTMPVEPAWFTKCFEDAVVTLVVGDHPMAMKNVRDLAREPHRLDGCTIPIRQNMQCAVALYGGLGELNDRIDQYREVRGRGERVTMPRMYVHLEGWEVSGEYVDRVRLAKRMRKQFRQPYRDENKRMAHEVRREAVREVYRDIDSRYDEY
jgi:hypothetical protein